jgi:CubicO group peptidase (beta-lactamase class C family)
MIRMTVEPALKLSSALTFALASALAAQDVTPGALSERLDAYRTTNHILGAVLAVAFADGRVISVASGQSDTARKLPMRPDDRLLMGSVGKTYVSAVALQLVRERRLDLDARSTQRSPRDSSARSGSPTPPPPTRARFPGSRRDTQARRTPSAAATRCSSTDG